ncbi:MAG: phosphodiesterase [Lentisphaeria bacterium]|nr:phosphodiesterase [Lentisphaeria bacterium]
MRFLIISDIHGATDAFQLAIDAFEREQADYFVLCGDLLHRDPLNMRPKGYDSSKIAKLLNTQKEKILAVRGNCDEEIDQMILEFPIMSNYMTIFFEGHRCLVTHGHLSLLPLVFGDIIISGHTHVPLLEKHDGIIYVNPGSTTFPKSLSKPSYAIMDETYIALKTLYDGKVISVLEWK